jgi:hypothetical protein
MYTFADVLFEMELRQQNLRSEAEEERWARQAAGVRVSGQSLDGIRRTAVELGDIVAGLRCQLQSRFDSNLEVASC